MRKNYDIHLDSRTPIDYFSIKYDMPFELARLLIGRTEAETARNIELMSEYLDGRNGSDPDFHQDDGKKVNRGNTEGEHTYNISRQLDAWIQRKSRENGKKLKQRTIAEAIGVSRASICFWRKGHCKARYYNIQRLTEYFGVSVEEFLNIETKDEDPANAGTTG